MSLISFALDPIPWTPSEKCAGNFWESSTNRDDTPWGQRVGGWVRLPTAFPNGDALERSRITPVHGCRFAKSCGVTLFGSEPQRCQLVTTTTTGGFNSRRLHHSTHLTLRFRRTVRFAHGKPSIRENALSEHRLHGESKGPRGGAPSANTALLDFLRRRWHRRPHALCLRPAMCRQRAVHR